MDCGEEVDGAFGNRPEFGAIFMSNIKTKKECLKRSVFALPYSHAEFVTHIKAGMILFLFEFRKRQLFGVYQASSDGALDIIPHAFNYSGRRFPAQVRFRQIWHCDPLSEKEFRNAIRENYFSANQFKFGLSKDQVRRLLYLFSSRKMKSRIPLNPRQEAIVEVAVKDRRWVGGDKVDRRFVWADEYDDIDTVAFSDRYMSSLAKGKEYEGLINDRVNAEGNGYRFPPDDFLAKKRRLGIEGRLTTDDVAENELYSHGYRRTFCTDSSKDFLDQVRRLANSGRLLTAQTANEIQMDKIFNPVQSSDHPLDQLDFRARDDYAVMQSNTFPDDYDMHSGYQQAFASDHYGNAVGQGKHVSNDRFLLDDCVNRDYNINAVKSMANSSDDGLNLLMQARDIVEDHELFDRKLEHRHHLDCDRSSISVFNPSASLLHETRKTTTAGRFEICENVPDFGTCSVGGSSSRNILHPLQRGYRNNEDSNYRIVDGRLTDNIVNKVPPTLATTAGYVVNADRRIVDGRFRKSEKVDNLEDIHTHTDPVRSMKYPSFSYKYPSLSSSSDKLFPEKHLSQPTISCNFDLPHSSFDDATITRAVPNLPDHLKYSPEYSASIKENQNSTSLQKTRPRGGSLGSVYPPSSDRLQQYILDPENFSRPQDTTHEFGNIGFTRSTSCFQTSLPQESVDSLVNPNVFMDVGLNTSAPVNYRGSLSSRLSPPDTDLENFGGEKGLLAHYSKSRDDHIPFHGNHPEASEHLNQHVPLHKRDMLAGKEFGYSGSEGLEMDIQPETDLAIYENQNFRFSSNMNLKEIHKTSETNSSLSRRSVFTRLSSKVPSRLGEERNNIDVNLECYMDATADEIMEMLQQVDGVSSRKLRKSRVAGQSRESALNGKRSQCNMVPDHPIMGKKRLKTAIRNTADRADEIPKETRTLDIMHRSAVNENKTQCNMETDHSSTEKNKIKSASQTTADRMDEIQKETRTLDFKRRSDKKKSSVGIAADSTSHSKPAVANEEVKISTSSTFRRRRLVRPVFSRTDTAADTTRSNEKLLIPAPILDKDDKQCCGIHESEIPNGITGSRNVLDSNKELLHPEEQNDAVAHVLPSTDLDLKGQDQVNDDHIGSSRETYRLKKLDVQPSAEGVLAKGTGTPIKETSQPKSSNIQTSVENVLAKDTDSTIKETSQQKNLDIQTSVEGVLAKDTDTTIKGTSLSKSVDIQTSIKDVSAIDTDTTVKETSQSKSLDIQTSIGGISAEDRDTTVRETWQSNIQTSVEDVLAKDTDTTIKETSQLKYLDIQTPVEGVLAKDTETTVKGTSQSKILDIQTSIEGVSAEDTGTAVKATSQSKSLDNQTSVEDVLVKATDTTIKETSQQKSLDVQTSFEGIFAKDTDTTITGLNLQESSLEGFKLGAGLGNSLAEEKVLKMKIMLTTKTDVGASSQ